MNILIDYFSKYEGPPHILKMCLNLLFSLFYFSTKILHLFMHMSYLFH